jgi:hypothetical protein
MAICQFCGGCENVNSELKTCLSCSACCGCGEDATTTSKSVSWQSERGRVVFCGPCAPEFDKCDLCSWFICRGMVESWKTANGKMTYVCFHCHKKNRVDWAKSGWSYKTNMNCVTPAELRAMREAKESKLASKLSC